MVEGLLAKQEKPSNTEILGELIKDENLPYITNLNSRNVKGLFKMNYYLSRLKDPKESACEKLEESINKVLALKCSVPQKKSGTRADQIVDALKHIIEDENQDNLMSLAEQIKK